MDRSEITSALLTLKLQWMRSLNGCDLLSKGYHCFMMVIQST